MKIRLIWVGKTKERFVAEGVAKYLKLLGHYAEVEVIEVKERKTGEKAQRRAQEGQGILKQTSAFVLLDEKGKPLGSLDLAHKLRGVSKVDFVIGGPYGVSEEVREAAREALSLSPMTFTHDMARLLLLEQLYRAMTINRGGGYHH